MIKGIILFILTTSSLSIATSQDSLTIICDIWPPYQIEQPGLISGFSTDVVRRIMDLMDQPIEVITAYPWKRALFMIETGQAHGLFSANYTPERERFAYYPQEPLIESSWIIFGRKGSTYMGWESLKGKRIGIVRGYSYTQEFLEYIRFFSIVEEANDDLTNFQKLERNRLDFAIGDWGNGHQIIMDNSLTMIEAYPDQPVKTDGLYLIFNRILVSEEFVQQFSNTLKEYKKSNHHADLFQQYFPVTPRIMEESEIPEKLSKHGSTAPSPQGED